MKRRMTLSRAVDLAIAEENRRFLSNPREIEEAQHQGDHWRQQMEDEGILPPSGLPRLTCHGADR